MTASRVAVVVRMEPDSLSIQSRNAPAMLWPYADLVAAEPIRKRSIDAVLSTRSAGSASVYVDDTLLLARLIERAPQLKTGRERWRNARPGLAVGAAALATYAGIWAFDLSPSRGVARAMPDKARAVLGESVLRTMPAHGKCVAAPGRAALGQLVNRLMPHGPITAENITVLNWPLVNAFAVPGNRIVLTRGLIEQAKGPDELAAVIGHEAGHSAELHPEATLVRSVGFWALVQMMFTGTPGAIGNIGVVLAQLGYTRAAEREADGHALRLLHDAHISPKPMGDFFRRMESRAPGSTTANSVGDILSSHPSNPERIARIDAEPAYPTTPALAEGGWKALKTICANIEGEPGQPVAPPEPMPQTARKAPQEKAAAAATASAEAAAKAEVERIAAVREAKRREKEDAEKVEAARLAAVEARAERAKADKEQAEKEKVEAEARKQAEKAQIERLEAVRREVARVDDGLQADENKAAARQQVASAAEPLAPALNTADRRIDVANKRLAANARDFTALVSRGQAYVERQDTTAAIEDFSRALAIRPSDANTLFWRASMYARAGTIDKAIADYDHVIKLQPRNFAAFNNRGSLYRSQRKLDLALADYSAAIAIDAKQAIALTNRALIYREKNNVDAALVDLNTAIAANSGYANAYVRRGETEELSSEREAAIADYLAVLRLPEPADGSEPHTTARARLTALGAKF